MSSQRALQFKYLFCDILNDPDYRARLAGLRDLAHVDILPRRENWVRGSVQSRRGTIYIQYNDEAHYVSYVRDKNDTIVIFDPSYPDGTYGTLILEKVDRIKRVFVVDTVRFDQSYGPAPQRSSGDTFCQTWSLAYFTPMREFLKVEHGARYALMDIIKAFMSKRVFRRILEEDWPKLLRWQQMSIDQSLVDLKEPCFRTSDDFLDYAESEFDMLALGRIMHGV